MKSLAKKVVRRDLIRKNMIKTRKQEMWELENQVEEEEN